MKLFKIISKNLKVLIRSRSSALVIILGPLLLILLVGMAFSNTSTFTLNIGVFSPDYNNLTTSYIDKLSDENYKIITFDTEYDCIEDIKSSGVHTCIIFPPDFELSNQKSNEIKFYIDQTKQNFVYAVINTISTSFVSRSSELSLDLTDQILDVISRTYNTITKKKDDELKYSIELSESISDTSDLLESKLNSNSIETEGVSDVHGDFDNLEKILSRKISDQRGVAERLLSNVTGTIDDSNVDFNFPNVTKDDYIDDVLEPYDSTDGFIYQSWNDTVHAQAEFVNATKEMTSSIDNLLDSIDDADERNKEVIAEISNGMNPDIEDLQDNLDDLDKAVQGVVIDIDSISISNSQSIINPITTTVETVVPEKTNLDYFFPSLIVLLIMFMSILLSSTLIIMEKKSRAYFRNYTTPTSDFTFILGTFLTSIFLMIVQILIVLGIASLVFKTIVMPSIYNITILIFLISSVFILLGMIIGYMFNTEQTAMVGAISIGSIILFTSDIILPIENMPIYVQNLAKYNPFVIGSEALKQSILFQATLPQISSEIKMLSLIIGIGIILIMMIQQIMKMNFINRFAMRRKVAANETPEEIRDIFRIDNHIISDQKELYRFIKRISAKEFRKLMYKKSNKVADFASDVLHDHKLSNLLAKKRMRFTMLKLLETYDPRREQKPKVKPVQPKKENDSLPLPEMNKK